MGSNDEVWIYAPGGTSAAGPYWGKGPLGDGDFWSGSIASDTVVVAVLAQAGASGEYSPRFSIDAVAHQWATAVLPDQSAAAAAPAPCNLDVTCYPTYQTVSKAVVQYDFMADSGGLYACSGAMINTRSSSLKPYMLTAHHCISTDSEARSIEARFFYQTSACGGTPPNVLSVPTVIGGTYLAGAPIPQGDFALVLLSSAPSGTVFAGWSVPFDAGASGAGIHHPEGSYKRIALGTRGPDVPVNVEGDLAPANLYYQMNWSSGVTQPGSSGSPLLNSSLQIVGTLTGGPVIPAGKTACDVPAAGTYGRFSNAYPAISSYLEDNAPSGSSSPVISPNGLVNAASFLPAIAPGMILSIFGTNLASGTAAASQVPLPTSLLGASVTINNKTAPLYFVSPTQLNVQVPFETLPGTANVTVSVNGSSTSQSMNVSLVAPGTFTGNGRIVPSSSGRRGDALILYITGQGPVLPAVATGAAPSTGTPVNQLPKPFLPVSLTIGGVAAQVFFAGVPGGLVGVTQINFFIPNTAPMGDQPVMVSVGSQTGAPAFLTVTP